MTDYRSSEFTVPAMRRIKHIHFVGIGGAGMCGIAEVLLNQGYSVSGSDLVASDVTQHLRDLGAAVDHGHSGANVHGADVVVISSAISSMNPEVIAAHSAHIPVVSRAEMLGELMRYRYGIAVAGTHGKTTTTSILTGIFQQAGLDPTFVIGGLLKSAGRNAGLGQSRYLIAEADESDASFLFLQPMVAVVTNIDRDHLETYNHDYYELRGAFVEFVRRVPFYGMTVVCIDDPMAASIIEDAGRPTVTYGFSKEADYYALDVSPEGAACHFNVVRPSGYAPLAVTLPLPGRHNVLNAVAAVATATEEGVDDDAIRTGLNTFSGVDRRFEVHDIVVSNSRITLIDDYGHHPTEVEYVIDTVRNVWPRRRVVMVYQPHRYTRTRDMFDAFTEVLATVDELILVQTYAANEDFIAGADSVSLSRAMDRVGKISPLYAETVEDAVPMVRETVQNNDILIVQGAGNVSEVSDDLRAL